MEQVREEGISDGILEDLKITTHEQNELEQGISAR